MPWLAFTVILLFSRFVVSDSLQLHGLHTPDFPVLHCLCALSSHRRLLFPLAGPTFISSHLLTWASSPISELMPVFELKIVSGIFCFFYFQLCCVLSAQMHLSSVPCSAPFPRFLDKWLFSRSSKVGFEIKYGTVKKAGTLKSLFHSLSDCLALPYFGQPLEGVASLLSCKYCQEAPVPSLSILFPRTFTVLPFLFRSLVRFFLIYVLFFFFFWRGKKLGFF